MLSLEDNNYVNQKVPLFCNSNEQFMNIEGFDRRFKLVLVKEGSGIIKLNNRTIIFSAPVVFFFNSGDNVKLIQSVNLNVNSVYFHPEIIKSDDIPDYILESDTFSDFGEEDAFYLRPFTSRNNIYKGYINIGPVTVKHMQMIIRKLDQEISLQKDKYWMCRSRSYFLELMFVIERLYSSEEDIFIAELPESFEDIERIILYLHDNYRKKITITELTSTFHTNRTSLSDRFFKATGMTIITYLNTLRIRTAATILSDTDYPVACIMERVGMTDFAHFGRLFRKCFGCSPSEFRQRNSRIVSR